jgi:hypothetical protein
MRVPRAGGWLRDMGWLDTRRWLCSSAKGPTTTVWLTQSTLAGSRSHRGRFGYRLPQASRQLALDCCPDLRSTYLCTTFALRQGDVAGRCCPGGLGRSPPRPTVSVLALNDGTGSHPQDLCISVATDSTIGR